MSGQQTTTTAFPVLDDLEDVWAAADALAQGRAVAHGFGAGYALTSRPDRDAVERVEGLTGGPAVRSGGVTTVPERVAALFDWSLLPREFPRRPLLDLVRDLLALGPFGFRGPAAAQLPAHLTAVRDGVRTVRLVAPGLGCPSRAFLGAALDRTGTGFLALVPADRPGRSAGTVDEPAADAAGGFGAEPGVFVLRHADEAAARARFPHHAPAPATVLAFHRAGGAGRSGLPALTLERPGSLSADHTRAIAATHGFALVPAPAAARPPAARTAG